MVTIIDGTAGLAVGLLGKLTAIIVPHKFQIGGKNLLSE
jgi:hypothetical protein